MSKGRKPNKYKAEKFQCYLPALTMRDLEWLLEQGYGSNIGEVGTFLIQNELDVMRQSGFIKKKSIQKK